MSYSDAGCRALAGNERWFLAHTLPRSERKAELHLGAQGFRTYLAQIQKTIRYARQPRAVKSPLFRRYLFVILDLDRDRWLSVRSTIGVSCLFAHRDGRPVPVPVGIVESLIEAIPRGPDAVGHRPCQRAARSYPVGPVCGFCRHARAAG
jgi:transcription antitermination factor NusG